MTFDGTPEELAALEQSLDSIGYHLDWIDANSNAYGTGFLQIAGQALTQQHNYADLFGVYPVEKAAGSPAASKIVALFKQYAPGQPVTLQVEQAFSMWLAFAVSAETCGANLTRKCVYDAGAKQTAWTGGGITAPVNESNLQAAPSCYDIEQATSSGWQPAQGWTPNTDGVFGCNQPVVKLSNLGQPLQLAAVGKSLSDLK
jgi:hypothetical protein